MKVYRLPDGITIRVKRSDYNKCIDVSNELMRETNMSYESVNYNQMIIQDVNNYLAQYESGDCKYKGLFEIDKELHKDPSMKIVPIALYNYFIKNIPILDTLKNHNNIYDFCLRLKVNKGWNVIYKSISDDLKISNKQLSKNVRYYVSNLGGALYKKNYNDDRLTGVNVGYITTIFNNYEKKEMKEYNINYNFYLVECNKIINSINNLQLSLF